MVSSEAANSRASIQDCLERLSPVGMTLASAAKTLRADKDKADKLENCIVKTCETEGLERRQA